MDLLQEFEYRGLLYQITDREGLAKRLAQGPITLYIGFDPTADSLHIGNFLQILALMRFQRQGHHPIAIVGGGTGLIGDPGGKTAERQLNPMDVVQDWTEKIRDQLTRYLDFDSTTNPARVISNYDWLGSLTLIPFLRDIGKHFSIGMMLAKDSVKSRLEVGISYTEFSYMILQAYDYLQLYEQHGCELQIGGSDQWGNIVAGVDLIRRIKGEGVYGMTQPLLTQADGTKLGKTEQGTVWLNPERTSPYQFYQYWINTGDDDVINFLKYFTFLEAAEITELEETVAEKPWEREAQRTLARIVTSMVHGPEAMHSAENISQALFYGKVSELSGDELAQGLNDVPSHALEGDKEVGLIDLLAEAGIAPSKRRAREDVKNGAVYINDQKITDLGHVLRPAHRLAGRYIVIRRGKNKYFLVDWQL